MNFKFCQVTKEQLDSIGRQLEISLTSLLNTINNELDSAAKTEQEVLILKNLLF